MRRRSRFLYLLAVHLALLGIVCQVLAIDHWNSRVEDVRGIAGSHVHSSHCHGNAASCSDAGGSTAFAVAPAAVIPASPPMQGFALRQATRRRSAPNLRKLPRPPRAA